MIGIYTIICKPTNRVYVGKATRLSNRLATHKSDLRRGRNHKQAMLEDFAKYGEENFLFTIVAVCKEPKLEDLYLRWINRLVLKFGANNIYNLMNRNDKLNEIKEGKQKLLDEIVKYKKMAEDGVDVSDMLEHLYLQLAKLRINSSDDSMPEEISESIPEVEPLMADPQLSMANDYISPAEAEQLRGSNSLPIKEAASESAQNGATEAPDWSWIPPEES